MEQSQNNAPEEQVLISKKEYDSLMEDSLILNALRAGGVDNWEWYEESLDNAGL